MPTPDEYGLELSRSFFEGAGKESADKIADTIGGFFPFFGLKRKAVDVYIDAIKNDDELSPEEKAAAIVNLKSTFKHLKNQKKIADIARAAAPEADFSETSAVDDEWLDRFMDSAKFVSDEGMQLIWGRILAGEFENPGSTPPSTMRVLAEITPKYAKAFQTLCSLEVQFEALDAEGTVLADEHEFVLPEKYEYLEKYGVSFSVLTELEALGLIRFDGTAEFGFTFLNADAHTEIRISYAKDSCIAERYQEDLFPCGVIILTQAGGAIASFTETVSVPEHFSHVVEYLKGHNVVMKSTAL